MYHGIINVYKEAGYTSHDVVAKLRGICRQKKIGHTGTLDPDAVGVLPVCLGSGTRVCGLLTDRQKEYVAVFRLGTVTDTQDVSGTVLWQKPADVSEQKVEETALSFVGESMQVPPMYSALKVNGKKLYELARAGKEVERPARPITVYELEILEKAHPEYRIRVVCSKGTYIRTLCHDIGQALGCGAVMVSLERTRVGEFDGKDAYTLSEIQKLADGGRLAEVIRPVDSLFPHFEPVFVQKDSHKALRNGNQLKKADISRMGEGGIRDPQDGEEFRVYSHQGIFTGIYQYEEERKLFVPVKLFPGMEDSLGMEGNSELEDNHGDHT